MKKGEGGAKVWNPSISACFVFHVNEVNSNIRLLKTHVYVIVSNITKLSLFLHMKFTIDETHNKLFLWGFFFSFFGFSLRYEQEVNNFIKILPISGYDPFWQILIC